VIGREFPYRVRSARRAGSCACADPAQALLVAERATLLAEPALGESTRAHRSAGTTPIVLGTGPQSKCRPFFKVEKDPAKFAACNALADEIGPINTPKKAHKLIEEAIGDEISEVFGLVTLDIHLRMKSIAETGRGDHAAVMAPMKPTLQTALIDGADAIILFHVHPSGIDAKPSQADKDTTKAFEKAFEVVDIDFIDHVITAGDSKRRSWFSFAEEGLLK
jgi:DNA repair protein RadC